MKKQSTIISLLLCIICVFTIFSPKAYAWTDQVHLAIGYAAGFKGFHNDSAPDVSHTVAILNNLPKTDAEAHFYDATHPITPNDVYTQLKEIGAQRQDGNTGYLLGEILHTVRMAKQRTSSGKFDDYYYAVLCHYVGDLSMPLHVSAYDAFNKKYHFATDSMLDYKNVPYDIDGAERIAKEIKIDDSVRYHNETDVVNAIVSLANKSYNLSQKMRAENRMPTHEEAIEQVSRSATMFKALMRYCGKLK
ncbi:phospholipase C/P1 nuclease family protein [Pectinatus sottacetonis]|uniref:hypothetical protein n=1 Tax=Pectinatus sottacetonis TaxID=1002795 RepID=UPI0018C6B9AA|nr:hypothetical protein [Pectinatus sottacetonis]